MSENDAPKKDEDAQRVERRKGDDRRSSSQDRRGSDRVVTSGESRRQKPDRRKN